MHTSLLWLGVVVVVVAAYPALAFRRSVYLNGPAVRWPWLGPSDGPPSYMNVGHHPSTGHFPSGGPDFYGDYSDYSNPADPAEDLNRRIMEVRRRCHEDFLLLRRLLQEQDYPMRRPQHGNPWLHPIFRFPLYPHQGTGEEEQHNGSDGFPPREEVDYEDSYDDTQDSDHHEDSEDGEISIVLDSPTPGPEWAVIPYLPEVPDADELPDNYNNVTHAIHIVNGSRVEVNTTTNKETDNSIVTFFHTEVINILPDEDPKVESPDESEDTSERTLTTDEGTTEEPVPTTTPEEEEEEETTTTKSLEEPTVEDETRNELPLFTHRLPAAELVAHEVSTV